MRVWAVCALALAGATGCDVRVGDEGVSVGLSAGRADDEWVRTYTLPQTGQLEILNANGPIEVGPSSGSAVEVHVYRDARAGSDEAAAAALQTIEIVEEVGADRVTVEARPSRATERRPPGGRRDRVMTRVHVRVPPGLTTAFRTQNGQIRLESVTGRITAATSNGGVTGAALDGGVTVSVGNGSVRIDMESVEHPIDITVLNGGIRLELAADVRAELEASALNGRVSVDAAFGLPAVSGPRFGAPSRISGSINGGGPAISLQATNGAVRITVRGSSPDAASGR